MEAVKKYWFWGILISILSIFAMSHNASALDLNFENYSIVHSYRLPNIRCNTTQGSRIDVRYCSLPVNNYLGLFNISGIYINEPFNKSDLKPGDIFEFYIAIKTINNNNLIGGNFSLQAQTPAQGNNFTPLGYELIDSQDFMDYSVTEQNLPGEDYGFVSDFFSNERVVKVYKITHVYTGTGTGTALVGLADATSYLFSLYSYQNDMFEVSMPLVNHYRFEGSEENREVQEKTQEAVDDSQDAGGSSSQDAQTGTTGLLNAITGAVSVISSASPTNCKINGNMGNLDMGQLDLCANPAPAFIQTIGSLILILMCVPLAISLFNRFIAIFRSFQS